MHCIPPILPVGRCTMSPPFSRAQITPSVCFQNVAVPEICEAVMQSNPLTYVNLYALNLAARLGDRLRWVFFQTIRWMQLRTLAIVMGRCLFLTSK